MTPESRNSSLLRNGSVKKFPAEMNTYPTIEGRPLLSNELVNMFSVGSDPRLCKEGGQLRLKFRESLEMAKSSVEELSNSERCEDVVS
jgi:hypothetical protein